MGTGYGNISPIRPDMEETDLDLLSMVKEADGNLVRFVLPFFLREGFHYPNYAMDELGMLENKKPGLDTPSI